VPGRYLEVSFSLRGNCGFARCHRFVDFSWQFLDLGKVFFTCLVVFCLYTLQIINSPLASDCSGSISLLCVLLGKIQRYLHAAFSMFGTHISRVGDSHTILDGKTLGKCVKTVAIATPF
jgi:hypothetical protein